MRFAVGYKLESKPQHVLVDASDALAAALKVREALSKAKIIYVRPQNRRGDKRHSAPNVNQLN